MYTKKLSYKKSNHKVIINSLTFIYLAGLIILSLLSPSAFAGEFAVSPMMIDLDGEVRSEQAFSFNLYGKSNTNVKLDFYNMTQLESGYMGFQKASMDNLEDISNWVELEDDSYRLRDGDVIQVNGTINIPSRASGTHLLAIMVEEDLSEETEGGIAVKIRYAVVLNLNIEGRRSRIETSFEELAVVETEEGLFLEGYFTNSSSIEDWLYSEVQIRGENNRLLERVSLQTQSAWQRADNGSRVFPGARVRVYGQITEAPETGQYNIMVRNNFADRSQPVYRDVLAFQNTSTTNDDNDNELTGNSSEGQLLVNPDQIEIEVRRNNTSFTSFFLENTKTESINLRFPDSIDNLDTLGVSDFEFYPDQVEVEPNQKVRVVLRQTHLADSEYGNIIFPVSTTSADTTSTISIPTIARN